MYVQSALSYVWRKICLETIGVRYKGQKWKMLSWNNIVSNCSFVECSSAGAHNNDAASSNANLEKEE